MSLGRRLLGQIAFLLALVFLGAGLLPAQDFRATILGQVADKTKAAIPDASVVAVKTDTSEKFSTKTNVDGIYSLPMLTPGAYTVTVEAFGFAKTIHQNVTLTVDQKLNLDFALDVKAVKQEVTVTDTPDVVETATGSGGTLFDSEQTSNLPLNGRQVYQLLQLAEGVMFTQEEFGATGHSGTRAWDVTDKFTMNGGVQGSNRFMLNGAPISVNGMWQVSPAVEAIREFKVMTNSYDASIGRSGGGAVNTTLKSGGNDIHGSLFEYLRNSILDANYFQNNRVGAPRGKHIMNQFGGTVGGPIQKKKTFYFFSYEGHRERVPFPQISSTVPSYLRPGPDGSIDFSTVGASVYDPLTTYCSQTNAQGQCSRWYRQQFARNVIPAARMNPVGLNILKLYPLPNAPGCQGPNVTPKSCPETVNYYASSNTGKYRYNQEMVRADHTLNDANRFSATFTYQLGFEDRNSNGFPPPAERGDIISERDNFNIILGWTHVFGNAKVGDLRMSFGRYHQRFPNGERDFGLTAESLGMKLPNIPTTSLQTAPRVELDRMTGIIANNITEYANNHLNVTPSLSQTLRRHTLKYGGEFSNLQYANPAVGYPRGTFTFNKDYTRRNPTSGSDGYGVAGLVLGYPGSGYVDWNDTMFESWRYYAGYIQDDYKVRRNVTINLGMRYDFQTSIKERFDRINAGFCFTCVSPIDKLIDHKQYPYLPNPIRGGLQFAGKDGQPRAPYNTYYDQIQPRFGFAWAVQPRMIVRGGAGLLYGFADQHDTTTGFSQRTNFIPSLDNGNTPNPYAPLSNPFPDGAAPPDGSAQGLATSLGRSVSFDLPTRRLPRTWQYSLGIQRELPLKVLLEVKYVGSQTSRVAVNTQWDTINEELRARAQADPAFLDTKLPNPFYGILDPSSDLGKQPTLPIWQLIHPFPQFSGVIENTNPGGKVQYDALQVRAEKRAFGSRPGRGMTFVATYTWQKNFSRDHYLNNSDSYRNDTLIREIVGYDRTHNFTLNAVWNLPFGKNGLIGRSFTGWKSELVSGWATDWIFTDRSGIPTTWPNVIFTCASYKVERQTFSQWFNNDTTNCYKSLPSWVKRLVPDRFPWIRNPWAPQLAVTARKTFNLTERYKLEARIESFNTMNTPIFKGPATDFSQKPTVTSEGIWSGFGTITPSQQNFPRNVQVSMRLRF